MHDVACALEERNEARGEIETLRSELASASADDESYQHTAATLQDRTRERDALAKLRVDLAEQFLAAESSLHNAAREIASLQRANSGLETELAVLRKQRDGYREAGRETQVDLEATRARVRELETHADASRFMREPPP